MLIPVAAAVLMLIQTATPAAPASHAAGPAVSPDGAWVAFSSNRDGTPQIYVVRADGSGERQVTRSAPPKAGLRWSTDGRQLQYTTFSANQTHLFSVDLDGANEHEWLMVPGRDPQLSPDGRRVVYAAGSYTATELMVADVVDGAVKNARRINDAAVPIAWNAKWSPDGTRLAFTGRAPGTAQLQVWIMDSDGTNAGALTAMPPDEGGAQVPSWSPDGRTLAFQTNAPNGSASIWLIDVRTKSATKVLSHSETFLDETPKWFPDGRRLTFQSTRTGRMEVWVVNADGSNLKQLTK